MTPAKNRSNQPATGACSAHSGHFTRQSLVEGGVEFYRKNGLLILDDALDSTEVAQLRDETVALCRGERGGFSKGWAQPPEIAPDASDDEVLRQIIMVAGNDPYAYKGTTQPAEMLIRPEGIGGCGDGRMSLDEYKHISTSSPQS